MKNKDKIPRELQRNFFMEGVIAEQAEVEGKSYDEFVKEERIRRKTARKKLSTS